jgi:indolepyruvate ferredoxin oxidoreductase
VAALLPHLSPENLDRCVAVASAPDEVRGYEDIKLAGVARYRERLDELTAATKGAS